MKRCLCLALCFLLLFLCACKKQEPEPEEEPPEPEMGVFYTADGLLQNTLITLVLASDDLVTPVTGWIRFEFYNNTGYPCAPGITGQIDVYRRKDGEWLICNSTRSEGVIITKPDPPKSSRFFFFWGYVRDYTVDDFGSEWIPGFYRACLEVAIWDLPEEFKAYRRVTAVTYFTVSDPAE